MLRRVWYHRQVRLRPKDENGDPSRDHCAARMPERSGRERRSAPRVCSLRRAWGQLRRGRASGGSESAQCGVALAAVAATCAGRSGAPITNGCATRMRRNRLIIGAPVLAAEEAAPHADAGPSVSTGAARRGDLPATPGPRKRVHVAVLRHNQRPPGRSTDDLAPRRAPRRSARKLTSGRLRALTPAGAIGITLASPEGPSRRRYQPESRGT